MENNSWQNASPGSSTPPTAAQAQEALNNLNNDGAALSGRVVTPWCYHSALGVIVAAFVGSLAIPGAASTMVVAICVVAIPLLTTTYSRRYGVTITQPAGPRSKRLLLMTLGIALIAVLSGVAIKLTGSSPWWINLPVVVAFAATVILGRKYDDALRGEIASDNSSGYRSR